MTKKISLVTKADAIYGSVLGICSIRLRPLPHSFYSTNYSLGATGEGLWRPCHFYRLEGQGQLLQFSQTKRKGKMRQPLAKGRYCTLAKSNGLAAAAQRSHHRSKTSWSERELYTVWEWTSHSSERRAATWFLPAASRLETATASPDWTPASRRALPKTA